MGARNFLSKIAISTIVGSVKLAISTAISTFFHCCDRGGRHAWNGVDRPSRRVDIVIQAWDMRQNEARSLKGQLNYKVMIDYYELTLYIQITFSTQLYFSTNAYSKQLIPYNMANDSSSKLQKLFTLSY